MEAAELTEESTDAAEKLVEESIDDAAAESTDNVAAEMAREWADEAMAHEWADEATEPAEEMD